MFSISKLIYAGIPLGSSLMPENFQRSRNPNVRKDVACGRAGKAASCCGIPAAPLQIHLLVNVQGEQWKTPQMLGPLKHRGVPEEVEHSTRCWSHLGSESIDKRCLCVCVFVCVTMPLNPLFKRQFLCLIS